MCPGPHCIELLAASQYGWAEALAGADPSSPPIWVPYQDLGTKNTAPSWATTLYCTKNADGTCNGCVQGERCMTAQSGECYCDSW